MASMFGAALGSSASVPSIWTASSLGGLAAVARGFAPHQIVGLNGGGAFVDGQNLGIAVVLGHAGFFDKAHAAMHLHGHAK
jgi:hypothetical protein